MYLLFDVYVSRILHLLVFIVFPIYLLHVEKQHHLSLKLKLHYLLTFDINFRYFEACKRQGTPPNKAILAALFKVLDDWQSFPFHIMSLSVVTSIQILVKRLCTKCISCLCIFCFIIMDARHSKI